MNERQEQILEEWIQRRPGKAPDDYPQRVGITMRFCKWCSKTIQRGEKHRDCGSLRFHNPCATRAAKLLLHEALCEIDVCE